MNRIIDSSELRSCERITLGAQYSELETYGGLRTPYSDDVIVLSEKHQHQIATFASAAANLYGPDVAGIRTPEMTHVQRDLGKPTLVARVDCTVDQQTGDIVPYELEESPSGAGLTHIIHQAHNTKRDFREEIRRHYLAYTGLPHVIISGARNHGTDDAIIVGDENYTYVPGMTAVPADLDPEQPVIVKAIPTVAESVQPYLSLQDRALCTMTTEGDKTYGRRLGLYREITDTEDLLVDGELPSLALKRSVGSMAMGVSMYLDAPDRSSYGKKGVVTAGRLVRDAQSYIDSDGSAYIQAFHGPLRVDNPEGRSNLIMRVFTLLNPHASVLPGLDARVIGGCYVARAELLVHGAMNAVAGAVVI